MKQDEYRNSCDCGDRVGGPNNLVCTKCKYGIVFFSNEKLTKSKHKVHFRHDPKRGNIVMARYLTDHERFTYSRLGTAS